MTDAVQKLLEREFNRYHQTDFISSDPISIPHQFSKLQDIEISAFWTAILSWGKRSSIINSANHLLDLMDRSPFDFIMNHKEADLKKIETFKHRTFQPEDSLYFIAWFRWYYTHHKSLETAFLQNQSSEKWTAETSLHHFHHFFFSLEDVPQRTKKHISDPMKGSTCKRLNMFLRWMCRSREGGVDFGLWKNIPTEALMIPLDVHVERVARKLGLLKRKQRDWTAVKELTQNLKIMDAQDPVRFDYALFGMGVMENQVFY